MTKFSDNGIPRPIHYNVTVVPLYLFFYLPLSPILDPVVDLQKVCKVIKVIILIAPYHDTMIHGPGIIESFVQFYNT